MKTVIISNFRKNRLGTTSFDFKMEGMRKTQDFATYPIEEKEKGSIIVIQSDTRIGRLELSSGVGVMSQSHPNGAYFHHLSMDKMTAFKLDENQLQELKKHIFNTASKNAGIPGVITCDNSGAVNVLGL